MARRILYLVLVLIGGYISYQLYNTYSLRLRVFDPSTAYAYGPEDADLKVVEFIDFSCRYCQMVHPTIMQALEQDGNVLYIPRPLVSNKEGATYAAQVTYAAGRQGKFFETMNHILHNPNMNDKQMLQNIAQSVGFDPDQAAKDIKDEDLNNKITLNNYLFYLLKGTSTPMFLIGKKIIYTPENEMPDVKDFLNMFEEARSLQ